MTCFSDILHSLQLCQNDENHPLTESRAAAWITLLRKWCVKSCYQQATFEMTFLTCTHSLLCRSSAEPGSWACPCRHRSRMALWFAGGVLCRPCQCRDRTAAHGCSRGELGQRISSEPCCTLVGYMAQIGPTAGCRLKRIPYEASDTSRLYCTPWQHPSSGWPWSLRTLEEEWDTNERQKAFRPSVWFEYIKSQAMFTNDFKV